MIKKKNTLFLIGLILVVIVFVIFILLCRRQQTNIINSSDLKIKDDVPTQVENSTQAVIHNIVPNQIIASPLLIKGKAKGTWFFEASFPIKLFDSSKKEIATTIANAKGDWMTTDFVEFEATLNFEKPNSEYGFIAFEKDNPSGLPENDQEIFVPIKF